MSHRDHGMNRILYHSIVPAFLLCVVALSASAQTAVLTQHNDAARTGQNTNETILTTSNVNVSQFGKLFSLPADGEVYAQPLYVPNVKIAGGTHNVLIVATENDSVYAFDADANTGANASPLWKASLVDAAHGAGSGEIPLNSSTTIGCHDVEPKIGITSTPVIDPTSHTIYVEAKSTNGSSYFHRLHALDLLTGSEKSSGPVVIAATVSGSGDGSTNGQLVFDSPTISLHQLNRPALLLVNNTIYVAFASHCDFAPYHGWLFAYDTATFARKGVYVTTPNGGAGGFWMSGSGVAADANGNIYIASGNGDFDTTNVPAKETGDTLLKVGIANQTLTLLDYFTPGDQHKLNVDDRDLGSGGVLLLPDQPGSFPHILVQAGKEGRIYVVNRDQMTKSNSHYCSGCTNDTEIIEESASGAVGGMWSMPSYWNNTIYFWGSNDLLKAIPITIGLPDFTHISSNSTSIGFPGATTSVSSNGTAAGTAILWAIDSSKSSSPAPAVLYAYDATNVSKQLWNSTEGANNRDRAGNAVKFSTPTISNGKVYVGTSTEVDVYGLLHGGTPVAATPVISPATGTFSSAQTVTITDSPSNAPIHYTTDGSTPAAASTLYSGSFTVSKTTTVKAIAVGNGFTTSGIASSTITIQMAVTSINFGSGFSGSGMTLNRGASLNGTRLRLTDGGFDEARSAFFSTLVNVQSFTTDFSFQITPASTTTGDGFTFTIQGNNATALGGMGGGLGYGPGIPTSVAVKFDLYNNAGEGVDSTGFYTNGASPTIPAQDMTSSGVNLHSGDVFKVHMTYSGTSLAMTITDAMTGKSFSTTFLNVNIPSLVGGNTAFAGFTGGTGGVTATQEIISWTYSSSTTSKTPIQYEPESSTLFNASKSSGPTYRVFPWTGFTDGNGTILDATAAGQSVTMELNVAKPGTYDVKYAVKMKNTRGISQLAVNSINVGRAEDQYSPAEAFQEFDVGNVTFATSGNQSFTFTITGKNAASAGFSESFDYIKLTPQ